MSTETSSTETPGPRIHVVHATAPGCAWSWGYEAVMNRLRLVYGDQIDLHVVVGCPYDSFDQWLKDYGMGLDEALEWLNEGSATMGVPLPKWTKETMPDNVWPATAAALAALRQGEEPGWRSHRALLRMIQLEQRDPAVRDVLLDAAREARLDVARFERDLADEPGIQDEFARQHERAPPVHVGFYNFAVTDGDKRRVILDYAFEPHLVEGAIDYLSGGTLVKREPTDVAAYVREHAYAPLSEVRRVFALTEQDALARLEALEKKGEIERVTRANAPHWKTVEA